MSRTFYNVEKLLSLILNTSLSLTELPAWGFAGNMCVICTINMFYVVHVFIQVKTKFFIIILYPPPSNKCCSQKNCAG